MTERPMIFSAPMVRAILDGRKTQTRRVLKLRGTPTLMASGKWADSFGSGFVSKLKLPAEVGDVLWVREAYHLPCNLDDWPATDDLHGEWVWYAATDRLVDHDQMTKPGKQRPSIHMPRWASRITLRVTDVRVQRLQDISEEDAEAEGARPAFTRTAIPNWPVSSTPFFRWGFEELWTSIHGPASWEANPWVAAVTFEKVTP